MAQEQKATAHRTTAAAIRLHLHPVMLEQRTLAWALHVLWPSCARCRFSCDMFGATCGPAYMVA